MQKFQWTVNITQVFSNKGRSWLYELVENKQINETDGMQGKKKYLPSLIRSKSVDLMAVILVSSV